ncbi:MAG: hypothetical protein ACPGVE_08180 [Flavobacteriales bacterium]
MPNKLVSFVPTRALFSEIHNRFGFKLKTNLNSVFNIGFTTLIEFIALKQARLISASTIADLARGLINTKALLAAKIGANFVSETCAKVCSDALFSLVEELRLNYYPVSLPDTMLDGSMANYSS